MNARGLTLLEVMVALVVLGLVVVAYLELFGGALRGADTARAWSQAVTYASDGMERAKLHPSPTPLERLPGGFERHVEIRPWDDGLTRISVVVALPGSGRYVLDRLVRTP